MEKRVKQFYCPKMEPGKPRWPKNIGGPGRGSDVSMGWTGEEVKLRGEDRLGKRAGDEL